MEISFYQYCSCWYEQTILQPLSFLGKNNMSKRKENFNVTQGMTLLLLKKLSLPANLVFQLILFITDPENNIGYED